MQNPRVMIVNNGETASLLPCAHPFVVDHLTLLIHGSRLRNELAVADMLMCVFYPAITGDRRRRRIASRRLRCAHTVIPRAPVI